MFADFRDRSNLDVTTLDILLKIILVWLKYES